MHAGPQPTSVSHGDNSAPRHDLLRSTHEDGGLDPAFRASLADAVGLYRYMVTLRLVSARMVDLQRGEKVAFHSSSIGEEAVIVAATLAARENDWVFPGVREWGASIVRGLPIADYMHHAFGSGRDPAKGHSAPDHPPARRFRVAPASGIPGAHLPQAVGAAWAAKIKKDDVAAIAIFGEAATSTGDLHNALNFAGVFKPACVFVCRSARGEAFAAARERALAYGIASASVDGGDALAVLTVVRAALARAVLGKGPTLIEAVTQPFTAGEADPLVRLKRVLEREKLLDAAADEAFGIEIRTAIDAAVTAAEHAGPPATSTIFDDVYRDVPAHLVAQKESSPWRR
jgi:TPP-dependent pyruvate/acetoin dehydrogenase alpha subunit